MQTLFLILAIAELLVGLWALWGGIQWFLLVRRGLLRHHGFFAPKVALIVPCKGLERGLEENLAALVAQDYPSYELFIVFAKSDDPAYSVARKIVDANPGKALIVVAGVPANCGEKVNNLRVAVEQLDPSFDVFAFADSDGRPGRQWLARLVAPLADVRVGASTTFRWWLPDRGGFWSALGAAWDASIVTMQGDHAHNFCWGGGTAIRRQTFEQAQVLRWWAGALSDDWAMTNAVRSANQHIHFVPECLVPTLRDSDLSGLLEFTNRQIIITRVYAPNTWTTGAVAQTLYCATVIFGAAALVGAFSTAENWLQSAVLLCLVLLLAAAKGLLRWISVSELLPAWKDKMEEYAWVWTMLAPLAPFLYLVNFAVSAFQRRIVWRGVRYQLVSISQTRIL
jgi:ceramide glucosyltransferase